MTRRQPAAAFWIVLAVVLPALYVASFGPACWITSRVEVGSKLLPLFYRPLIVVALRSEGQEREVCAAYSWMEGRPERVPVEPQNLLASYARLAARAGWRWRYSAIYTIDSRVPDDARVRLGDEAWRWTGDK